MLKTPLLLVLCCAAPLAAAEVKKAPAPPAAPLYVFNVRGTIDPVVKDHLHDGFALAREAKAAAVLIVLDTPGGLLDATRDIVQDMLNAPFPVIVYVAPPGARAASAGVFIMQAADVAAMASQTHLGAAHPVSIGGGEDGGKNAEKSPMADKAVSDAAAYIRALAEAKGRNAAWAEKAVRDSVSLTSEEALREEVIDVIAESETDLFAQLKGSEVDKNGATFPLDLAAAPRVSVEMSLLRRWLHVLAHPTLAYLLLTLGFYALIYEFSTPGVGFGGVVGALSLLLAFFGLQVLPLNYAGLALLALGAGMMAMELVVHSGGFLTAGGAVCFAVGSIFLFDSAQPYFRVSLWAVGGALSGALAFLLLAVPKILEARRRRPVTGAEGLVDEVGQVRRGGMVYVHGEYWTADCATPLKPGDHVRVLAVSGNKIEVEKI